MRMTRQVVFLSNAPYMLEGGVGLQRELVAIRTRLQCRLNRNTDDRKR